MKLCSKIQKKNPDSASGVAKGYMSEYLLFFPECYTQQEHFKIQGSFKFQNTAECLKNIS